MLSQPSPFPRPDVTSLGDGHYRFKLATRVVVKNEASDEEKMAGEWVMNCLENFHSFHAATGPASALKSIVDGIHLVDASSPGSYKPWMEDLNIPSDLGTEEVFIRGSEEGVVIAGGGPRGVFYGAQIFCELLETQNARPALPFLETRVGPGFPTRGILLALNIPRPDPAFLWRVLGEMMRLRMNTLMLKVNRAMRFESCPELSGPRALTRLELLGIVDTADAYGIEVIPYIDCLTRQDEFLLAARPDLAANPELPFAYDTSIPDTHKLMRRAIDEVLDVFGASQICIGMAGVPDHSIAEILCPPSSTRSAAEVFTEELSFWRNHLKSRDVRIIVSAEGFLSRDGSPPLAELRPDDGLALLLSDANDAETLCAPSFGLIGPSHKRLSDDARLFAQQSPGTDGILFETACPATELDFQRRGLLETLEDAARILWDPSYQPPVRGTSLSGMILRDA